MPDATEFELESRAAARCSRLEHAGAASSRPHPLPGDTPHYARDLVVDVRHIKLEIRIDPVKRYIEGTATHTLSPINDGVSRITFDAAEMSVKKVTAGGKAVRFDYDDPVLH